MMVDLIFFILVCAIFIFFIDEFTGVFKKIMAIRGMKLVLPLIMANVVIVCYRHWISWSLLWIKWFLYECINAMATRFPFWGIRTLSTLLVIVVVPLLPVIVINSVVKKKTLKMFPYSFITSMIIWIVLFMLLTGF